MTHDGQPEGTRPPDEDIGRNSPASAPKPLLITRRDLLRAAGAAGAAALIPAPLDAVDRRAAGSISDAGLPGAVPSAPTPARPLINLTARETEILSAIVDRLIPSDELGPGALEAGALQYIDRALGGAESSSFDVYRTGLAALDHSTP